MKRVDLLRVVCDLFSLDGSKVYGFKYTDDCKKIEVSYQETIYEFMIPSDVKQNNELHINGTSNETRIYYGIMYNLLLEIDIGPVDVYYHLSNGKVYKDDRVLFYKYFEMFEQKYNSSLNFIEEKILEYISKEKSAIDGLFSFFDDYSNRYDITDIKASISKTLKQRIEAEAKQKHLITGNKVKSLF